MPSTVFYEVLLANLLTVAFSALVFYLFFSPLNPQSGDPRKGKKTKDTVSPPKNQKPPQGSSVSPQKAHKPTTLLGWLFSIFQQQRSRILLAFPSEKSEEAIGVKKKRRRKRSKGKKDDKKGDDAGVTNNTSTPIPPPQPLITLPSNPMPAPVNSTHTSTPINDGGAAANGLNLQNTPTTPLPPTPSLSPSTLLPFNINLGGPTQDVDLLALDPGTSIDINTEDGHEHGQFVNDLVLEDGILFTPLNIAAESGDNAGVNKPPPKPSALPKKTISAKIRLKKQPFVSPIVDRFVENDKNRARVKEVLLGIATAVVLSKRQSPVKRFSTPTRGNHLISYGRLSELCGGPLIACCNRVEWYDEEYCCINDYYSQRVRFCEDTTNPCRDLDKEGNYKKCCEDGDFSEREPWEKEACCVKQFDATTCCQIEPWYGTDKRCPVIPIECNYELYPERCCERSYDKTKCCSLEPNGFYDTHNCCAEDDALFDEELCTANPPPCDFKATREECCNRANLFDPELCCDATTTYYDPRCCDLSAPFYVESECPNTCPTSGTQPCVPECDYNDETKRAECCALQFIHTECCHLPDHDAIQNDFYLLPQCCAAFPHDFREDKCCPLPAYTTDPRCVEPPCDYTGTAEAIKACCTENFDVTKCCTSTTFPTDRRCPPPECNYAETPAECCQRVFDVTKCCVKTADGYYDDECCFEEITSEHYDPTKCPLLPLSCWNQPGSTPAVCCPLEFLDSKCCDASTSTSYYHLEKCCALPTPYYVETKCLDCPDGSEVPCNPPCNYETNRDECCQVAFDHHKCCDSQWHELPEDYYLTPQCCAIITDFNKDKCCILEAYQADPRCLPQPCDYVGTVPEIIACCLITFSAEECCAFEVFENKPECKCTYMGTPEEIKACCDKQWDTTECCKLPVFEEDPRCVPQPCDYVGTAEEIIACCLTTFSAEECCVFTEFENKPECKCTYMGTPEEIKACCDKQWDTAECCKLPVFEEDPRCAVDCAVITDLTQLLTCCQRTAPDITSNCCVFTEFEQNPICPCDYDLTPEQCCAREYIAERCCVQTDGGFYDKAKCCLEPKTSPYYNEEICEGPVTCPIRDTPAVCCTENDGAGFDKNFCCGQYGFYDVHKCCKLEPPYHDNAQCPPHPPQPPCQRKCSTTKVTNVNINDICSKKDTVIHIGGHPQRGGRPHKNNTIIHHHDEHIHRGL